MAQEGKYESGNAVRDTILHDQTGRMLKLYQEREKNRKALEIAKQEIEDETEHKRKFATIDAKFGASAADVFEEEFRRSTVGLVSIEEFRDKRRRVDEQIKAANQEAEEPKRKLVQKKCNAKLSFDEDDEDSEEAIEVPRTMGFLGKNPTVDTSFLPDEGRRVAIEKKKEELIAEWTQQQEKEKSKVIVVQFSYWDGVGHRRAIDVEKGTTVKDFLTGAFKILESDFPDLRGRSQNGLLYIKEDLIMPGNLTFYDLIKSRAQGPHGFLFDYEYDHEGKAVPDAESAGGSERHAGKVVDRRWYERNKHVFPASRWAHFDINKKYETEVEKGKMDYGIVDEETQKVGKAP